MPPDKTNDSRPDELTDKLIYEESTVQVDTPAEPGRLVEAYPVLLEAPADAGSPPVEEGAERRFGGGVIRAALIISLGNILTRIFGLGREIVLASFSGLGSSTAAFTFADNVLTTFFDLLVNGSISSALIPVLSRYADPATQKRAEFWHIVNTLLTLGLLFLLGMLAILELLAEPLAHLLANSETPEVQDLTAGLIRVILFGIVFLGVSSIMMAALQALQRFTWSALSLASRNASVIIIALIFSKWGVWSMVFGVIVGTFMLIVLQAPGLRDLPLRLSFDWRHPAIREILRLYAPIALGLLVTTGVIFIDRALADHNGTESVGAMRFATTLQQFTLGLVGSAISIAILPTLSRQAAQTDLTAYRHTLMSGLKLLMVLIIPATLGLLAISLPTVRLVYEHKAFTTDNSLLTFVALLGYLPGIPAAAIDQMLIFSFYARKNTLTPVLVGIVSNMAYLGFALLSVGPLHLGMIGLVIANSLQQVVHMTIMFVLLRRLFGRLGGEGLNSTTGKSLLASLLLGVVAFLVAGLVNMGLGENNFLANLLAVGSAILTGGISYIFALRVLKIQEMDLIWSAVSRRLKRSNP